MGVIELTGKDKINREKAAKKVKLFLYYAFLIAVGYIIIYPLVWLIFAGSKTNQEIFGSTALLPAHFSFDAFVRGWKGTGIYTYTNFFLNTFRLVVPTVFFTVISSTLVAYGFARFQFKGKKVLFGLLISTLMLPNSVLIIPRYILFQKLGWLNSYLPFTVPAIFACFPFFVFMLVQFFKGLPKELDESALLDGCNSFQTLVYILLPLCKPAVISVGLFQFIWTWNDFFNPFIFINSVDKYPLTLALRMTLDAQATTNWNQIMAMAAVSIMPCIALFFLAQKYFLDGIATAGIKG